MNRYDVSKIHISSSKMRRERTLAKSWSIHSATSFALSRVITDTATIQYDPYKCILHILRQNEDLSNIPDMNKIEITSSSICPDILQLTISSYLCDETEVERLQSFLKQLHDSMGNISSEFNREDIRAIFVDVVIALPAFSPTVAVGSCRYIDIAVEAIVWGPRLDDCLIVMIRRVFEELDSFQHSAVVIADDCRVVAQGGGGGGGGTAAGDGAEGQTVFSLADIRSKRQLVLTALKRSVMEGGEVYLQLFVRASMSLPRGHFVFAPSSPASEGASADEQFFDKYCGFISVRRYFRFSFVPSAPPASVDPVHASAPTPSATSPPRCFSSNPLDSLIRGLFFNSHHMTEFMKVCSAYSVTQSKLDIPEKKDTSLFSNLFSRSDKNNSSKQSDAANRRCPLLDIAISRYASTAMVHLQQGRWSAFAIELIPLLTALQGESVTKDVQAYVRRELSCFLLGNCGEINAMISQVAALKEAVELMIKTLEHHTCAKLKSDSVPTGESEARTHALDILQNHLQTIPECLSRIRRSCLAMYQLVNSRANCSESTVILELVMSNVSRLFHDKSRARPLLKVSGPSAVSTEKALRQLVVSLGQISSFLQVLSTSIGGNIMMKLLSADFSSLDHGGSQRNIYSYPATLMELIGFCKQRVAGESAVYSPLSLGPMATLMVAPHLSGSMIESFRMRSLASGGSLLRLASLSPGEEGQSESDAGNVENTIELLFGMGLNPTQSDEEGISVSVGSLEEFRYRREVPMCMAFEAVYMRYMSETHLFRALSESLFEVFTLPENRNPFQTMCRHLSAFSSLLHLWDYSDEEIIQSLRATSKSMDLPTKPLKVKNSYRLSKISVIQSPTASAKAQYICNGLSGLDNFIDIIFQNWRKLLSSVWSIPPFWPGLASSTNDPTIKFEMLSGIAVETAVMWSLSDSLVYRTKPASVDKPRGDYIAAPFAKLIRHPEDEGEAKSSLASSDEFAKPVTLGSQTRRRQGVIAGLSYLDPLVLEVVIKASHDLPTSIADIYNRFSKEVHKLCMHLAKSQEWVITDLIICASKNTAIKGNKREYRFPASRVLQSEVDSLLWTRVSTTEEVVIEGCVLMTDNSWNTTDEAGAALHNHLVDILDSIRKSSGMAPGDDIDEIPFQDSDRVCSQGISSEKFQSLLVDKPKVYVPATIRVSLLAYLKGLQNFQASSVSPLSLFSAETKKPTICSESAFARQVASTIWLSQHSSRETWECVNETETVERCVLYEATRRWSDAREALRKGNSCAAYQCLALSSLLTRGADDSSNSYASASDLTLPAWIRLSRGLAGRLSKVISCLKMLQKMMSSSSSHSLVKLNPGSFARTVMRHVCLSLRLALMDPQCVHLNGGYVLILRALEELEASLCLPRLRVPQRGEKKDSFVDRMNASFKGDVETSIRRAMGFASALYEQSVAYKCITQIKAFAICLVRSLQEDVISNFPLSVRNMLNNDKDSPLFKLAVSLKQNDNDEPLKNNQDKSLMLTEKAAGIENKDDGDSAWAEAMMTARSLFPDSGSSRPTTASSIDSRTTARSSLTADRSSRQFPSARRNATILDSSTLVFPPQPEDSIEDLLSSPPVNTADAKDALAPEAIKEFDHTIAPDGALAFSEAPILQRSAEDDVDTKAALEFTRDQVRRPNKSAVHAIDALRASGRSLPSRPPPKQNLDMQNQF